MMNAQLLQIPTMRSGIIVFMQNVMKTRTAATYPMTSATLMLASFHLPLIMRQTLKTGGRDFAEVDSTTDGCWRKNCAGNHDG
jgi:uncharacterized FlgJ-related protein